MINYPRWKVITVAVVMAAGILFCLPNLVSRETAQGLPGWLPSGQLALGLDLQGGSHLLMEVDTDTVVHDIMEQLVSEARTGLRRAKVGYRGLGVHGGAVSFTLTDASQADLARETLDELNPLVQTGNFGTGVGHEYEIDQPNAERFEIRLTEAARNRRIISAVQQSVEVIRRRIDAVGTREATIQTQGGDRILLQVPGADPAEVKQLVGKTARLTFHMVDMNASVADALAGRVPAGSMLVESDDAANGSEHYVVKNEIELSGENLVDSQPQVDQNNMPAVGFRFDNAGARKFGRITTENTGRLFAIVLDNKVISAPRINEPITGGSGIITGNFTFEEANNLSVLLRAGALPAPLSFVEERSVGPDLGADSVAAGKIASILAVVVVVAFMAIYYGLFGIFANIALLANLILILGALSLLGADAYLARHRRHRLDHRHGGRCQRADLRAHARGGRPRADAALGGRYRLFRGPSRHRRCQCDHVDRRSRAVPVRQRPGEGVCRHAFDRCAHLVVHRDYGHPAVNSVLVRPRPSQGTAALTALI